MRDDTREEVPALPEDDCPDGYDLSADMTVERPPGAAIEAGLWEAVLHYDGPDIDEQLCNPGLYHAAITQPLQDVLVGLRFHFAVEDGEIVAHGTAHPATRRTGAIDTETETTLETARVVVRPWSPRARRAMIAWIERPGGDAPPSPGARAVTPAVLSCAQGCLLDVKRPQGGRGNRREIGHDGQSDAQAGRPASATPRPTETA